MEFHLLDILMYFVTSIILWILIGVVSNGQFTHELGSIGGIFAEIIWFIIYVILFVGYDFNWIDIYNNIHISFKL